jgi:hypothetical protein
MVTAARKESTKMPLDLDNLKNLEALFHIHREALGHPRLKAISDEAMKQLEGHAKALEPEPTAEEVKAAEKPADDQGQPIDVEEAERVRAEKAEADKATKPIGPASTQPSGRIL